MTYDKENRLKTHLLHQALSDPVDVMTTYAYDGDGLKRTETTDLTGSAATTTLIWDGDEYLCNDE